MSGLNKVQLIGTLGKDPESKQLNNTTVATFTLATSDIYKDRNTGERKENTEWHRIVCWNRNAEIARDYLSKGKKVYIEGKIKTRTYSDKDGIERKITEIEAQQILMLDSQARQQQQARVQHVPLQPMFDEPEQQQQQIYQQQQYYPQQPLQAQHPLGNEYYQDQQYQHSYSQEQADNQELPF